MSDSRAIEIAQALIRCPSVTPSEGGALTVLGDYLRAAGYEAHRVTFSDFNTPDIDNLFAKIGNGAPHFVFAGHTDVVPPGDEKKWSRTPFSGDVVNGELFGRGACDMKGAVAAFAAAAIRFGKPKHGTISFLITGDEEGPAVNGTRKLLRWAAERGEKFDHCLLGEPTNVGALGDMAKIGRRGSLSGTLTIRGTQGHVAYPHLAHNPIPAMLRALSALIGEPLDQGSQHFDASNLEVTSVETGNRAFNVIPAEVRAQFNIRFNDLHTADSLRDLVLRRITSAAGDDAHIQIDWEPSGDCFLTEPGAFVDLVADVIHAETGITPKLSTSGGTSDARFIKDYCPVIEFGLTGQTMHKIDERVPVADVEKLSQIYLRILERYFA
ncbi:MAG: succinyl-diaminopimelate desuccinylase [Xanthobacteraceae bacterium]|nr:succinyl-diaminopimelate desuccinylase [Xanthobacteraceae bacterium]QYK45304.1 MAG: succinyl-diaminopimelate desuccinylase [Xanthobacteraceae bacterium]